MADDHDAILDGLGEREALLLGNRLVELEGVARNGAELETRHRGASRTRLRLRDGEQRIEGRQYGVGVGDRLRQGVAIAARIVGSPQGHLDTSLEAGQRTAQIVGEAVGHRPHADHQLLDLIEHLIETLREPVKLVAASLQWHPLRQAAVNDAATRLRNSFDPAQQLSAEKQRAGDTEDDGDDESGDEGFGDDFAKFLALLHIAADEQSKSALQPERLRPDLMGGFRAPVTRPDLEAEPAVLHGRIGWPAVEIAGQRLKVGTRQEIDAAFLSLVAAAFGHDLDETPETALGILLGQAADFGVDRRIGLAINEAERTEVEE